MNLKRVFSFAIAGGALAALIAGATTTGYRRVPPPPARDKRAGKSDLSGEALAVEIQRLHERLRPSTPPEQPARNLFEYRTRRSESPAGLQPTIVSPAAAPVVDTAPPAVELIGIATDGTGDAMVRTAILSGFGQLYLVKEGEPVSDRYRVVKVTADGVQLSDTRSSVPVWIVLR
jgi:hypothetical protein